MHSQNSEAEEGARPYRGENERKHAPAATTFPLLELSNTEKYSAFSPTPKSKCARYAKLLTHRKPEEPSFLRPRGCITRAKGGLLQKLRDIFTASQNTGNWKHETKGTAHALFIAKTLTVSKPKALNPSAILR